MPIVFDPNADERIRWLGPNPDLWLNPVGNEFDCVAEQISKTLSKQCLGPHDMGKAIQNTDIASWG
jgi:hypothetical protein